MALAGALTLYYVNKQVVVSTGETLALAGAFLTGPFLALVAWNAVRTTMRRLEQQSAALAEQARNPALLGSDLPTALRTITEAAARTLEVQRASIWFYSEDRSKIHCADLFEKETERHSTGMELAASDHPAYFRALAEERGIAVRDGRSDSRTRELTRSYLEPLGIFAMLAAPIGAGGKMVGVVCHEQTRAPREWALDEQSFAGSIADLVALGFEACRRRQAESALRDARDRLEHKLDERTRELAEANERLQELDRLKSEFLATMSHELRTPLNSIIGFTSILRQELAGPLNDEQKKQLGMVQSAGRHLLALINDLLDLSRIESGKLPVARERFKIASVVEEVVTSLAPLVAQKRLRFKTELDDPALELSSDRKKCFQILLNLANNALKFTQQGEVRICVASSPGHVTIVVSDTGIGIKPGSMTHLFEAFRQVDGSARRVYEGTGLGLYLCKQLTSMLGGEIRAESEFGAGSRFTVALPRETAQATK
jgi:signal transduction histidine kinase